ncbi:ATPase involved in chromosome partitioning [Desulfitobacterium dehalogenans ATCC 51507]|uniref:Iron-sulfur cluster carrier protein n=1 Tax=Desulfitobacterium dehalogenans (strain ATCC 51507 / DSM 9161 / JW/IU-DC1) TaxID=756499 RepID=I4AA63_DESDJ|nr:Mrp/NBP35 family ATP-binding protein [Desulfitobacterium dehalogenans]AFM00848.1 ATPase involved in chromosome partitioning [Desulfitobacterium dehalogenans ATCC 51507]
MSDACGSCPSASSCTTGSCPTQPEKTKAQQASNIKNVIAVMSGKGGVGKSSVTSMLAVSLIRQGFKVGILDADITGPSIPRIFGLKDKANMNEVGVIPGETSHGIKVMSLNLMIPNEDDPVIWRGSIITQLVQQFWTDVVWGELDYLLIDLPPGTGDVPITVMQSLPVSGVVIVTSPQQLAGMIVRKAINMVKKYDATLYGLVENMAYVACPQCEEQIEIFGKPHGEEEAAQNEIPYLGQLPIDPVLATMSDLGKIEDYESANFTQIARNLAEVIQKIQK